jgi:hypothetical protein
MNHPLDVKLEATYGYNPLELKRYADYLNAASPITPCSTISP